jgi:hypothetical protein
MKDSLPLLKFAMIVSVIGIIIGIILLLGFSIVMPAFILFAMMGIIFLFSAYKHISYTRTINIYYK